jgi:hypothetical protein
MKAYRDRGGPQLSHFGYGRFARAKIRNRQGKSICLNSNQILFVAWPPARGANLVEAEKRRSHIAIFVC